MVQQGFHQALEQSLRQEQVMAPHQIQSLEILTVPLLDLQMRINQELENNPALEMLEPGNDGDGSEAGSEAGTEAGDEAAAELAGEPGDGAPATAQDELAGMAAEKDEFLANLMQLDEGWDNYLAPSHARGISGPEDEEKRQFLFDSLAGEKTLQDDLLEQLHTSDCPESLRELAETIIGNLDEAGYLRANLDELATAAGANPRSVQRALKQVQSLEPAGIAARDLRECLLLQLDRHDRRKSLAWRVVERFLDQIARNRIPEVARALRVSTTELYEALAEIRTLQPRPGSALEHGEAQYVVPEVTISHDGGEYRIATTRDYLPRLRISPAYKRLLEDPNTPADVRRYIREKITNGLQFVNSLEQRQSTIHRIAEVVLAKQHEFFVHGEEAMRPMTMEEVAQEIGVHGTTVSRAIANKYVQTPQGLFPLRRFFSGGFATEEGEQLSAVSIKHKIQAMVSGEEAAHPLSDQHIVEALKAQGLNVARRTVAKYREELGIPSSHLRRSHS